MSTYEVQGWAAMSQGGPLQPFAFELGEIGTQEVDVHVEYCGLCHSDLSMLDNEWNNTSYPFVPGHEVIGTVIRTGAAVKGLQVGDRVGVGWVSGSCLHCAECLSGHQHLCATGEQTIVGRFGGFADTVRCHSLWATPLPTALDASKAGPLFCGGITVFNPILLAGVKPTDRVGVVGIGGLGHLALQFLRHWGCEVTAFTSSESKAEEARELGAHHVANSRDKEAMKALRGSLDFILSTVNVNLDWKAYLGALRPNGRLHTVGAILDPMPVPAFSLINGQKSLAGSPVGSPSAVRDMLTFCARHDIHPVTEQFPLGSINEAMEHLRAGKARYRVVLRAQ